MATTFYFSGRPAPAVANVEVGPGLALGDLGHIGAYAFLAFLASWALPRWRMGGLRLFALFLFSAGYGLTDEFHQSFVPGREASWSDVGLDASGAAAALVILMLYQRVAGKGKL